MHINAILDIGVILLAASFGAAIIKFTKLPRITSYIIIGIIIGPSLVNLVSPGLMDTSDLFTNIALSFIAFDLGRKFSLERIREIGKNVIVIAVLQVIVTLLMVTFTIYILMANPFHIAVIYGAIACATAPAATMLVAKDLNAEGKFTDTLLGIVALDDGLGILVFALVFAVAGNIAGAHTEVNPIISGLKHSLVEIFGAAILGILLGWILCHLPKVIEKSENLMIYTLGIILFNTGLCIHFELSVLLASMALGITVENLSEADVKLFHAVEKIESPFFVLFFVLAGAHLKIDMVTGMSVIGLIYILSRMAGKVGGAYVGSLLIKAEPIVKKWMGLSLLPQAGVALGFALIVKSAFPDRGQEIFFVITASTVFFEMVGPIFTKISLNSAGETK
jgi:Kef-type K+ transport system membrane component KefB